MQYDYSYTQDMEMVPRMIEKNEEFICLLGQGIEILTNLRYQMQVHHKETKVATARARIQLCENKTESRIRSI